MNLARLKLGTESNCLGGQSHGFGAACAAPAMNASTTTTAAKRLVAALRPVKETLIIVEFYRRVTAFGAGSGRGHSRRSRQRATVLWTRGVWTLE